MCLKLFLGDFGFIEFQFANVSFAFPGIGAARKQFATPTSSGFKGACAAWLAKKATANLWITVGARFLLAATITGNVDRLVVVSDLRCLVVNDLRGMIVNDLRRLGSLLTIEGCGWFETRP